MPETNSALKYKWEFEPLPREIRSNRVPGYKFKLTGYLNGKTNVISGSFAPPDGWDGSNLQDVAEATLPLSDFLSFLTNTLSKDD